MGAELDSFMRTVGSLNKALLAVGDAVAGAAGQTRARSECLQQIADRPRSVATIATRLEMTRQSVQRVADVLVDEGYARYDDNPEHRRAKLLTVTPAGHRALSTMHAAHEAWTARATAELSTVELPALTAQLLEILATVKRL